MTLRPDVKLIPPRGSNLVRFRFLIRNRNHVFEVMIKWSYRCRQARKLRQKIPDRFFPTCPLFPHLSFPRKWESRFVFSITISAPAWSMGFQARRQNREKRESVAPIEHMAADLSRRGSGRPWHAESFPSQKPNDKKN